MFTSHCTQIALYLGCSCPYLPNSIFMKQRASYTLEIFKIFFIFYHFDYHCIYHFFDHFFIVFFHLHFLISFLSFSLSFSFSFLISVFLFYLFFHLYFYIFFVIFVFFAVFISFSIFCRIFAALEAKMMKHDLKKWKMIKNEKPEENCNFPFFGKFLHHWKQKWWNMIKQWKKKENTRKIAIFHFLENVCTTGSKNDEKWSKKMIKKMKKRGKLQFPFSGKFLHHWKQKWWNMIKKMIKQWKNSRNIAIFHVLENFCTTGSKNDET